MTTPETDKPCACSSYSLLVLVHENAEGDKVWQQTTTRCAATTKRTFAPGHDAKLKSLLLQAGAGGHQVRRTASSTVVDRDAAKVAADLGWEGIIPGGPQPAA
ncbi:hypothetical protein SFUL_5553 [Streptomyces microflavus DSM 40593]|uniref:Uncharacterized protein n=1 Tax=Streptomyces microflavus DSM 40593 TaxID=1303692 RepID=N0CWD9_STRMI|nr:hypothetical protein [Streptomyces microflavus]AGK80441.1 hypothetical protein SFUL_5553 [Streptomyces microflavus DSM 40593]